MTRMSNGSLSGLFGLMLVFTSIECVGAQELQPAAPTAPQSALPTSPADASPATKDLARTDQPKEENRDVPSPPPSQSAATTPAANTAPVVKGKKGKQEYTGPTTLVVLAPMPMLDEEKKQRLDPDGKPMFYPPVKQQRDKYGHPLFDPKGLPVMQTKDSLGYDENGKKLHAPKGSRLRRSRSRSAAGS